MNRIQIWTLASRPKTLIASISPVCIGTVLAISHHMFDLTLFLFTLATAIGIQITTNFANDYFDFIKGADTPERKGPVRVTQAGLVSLPQMKRGLILSFLLTALSGSFLVFYGGLPLAFLLALSLLLAILYTGGPYPLAYLGLGEVFVFVFFGLIAVSVTYYLQTGQLSTEAVIAGTGPGLLSTAILIINNLRDHREDRQANKKTLIVRFGTTFGKAQYLIAIFASLIPLLYWYRFSLFALLIPCVFLPFIIKAALHLRKKSYDFESLFAQTGQLLWLYTLLFFVPLLQKLN